MKTELKDWFLHYFYGLLAAVFNGTVSTVYVSFGASGAQAAGMVDLKGITFKGFLSVFLGTIAFHAVSYFYGHRIPDDMPDSNGVKKDITLRSVMTASRASPPEPPEVPAPAPAPSLFQTTKSDPS